MSQEHFQTGIYRHYMSGNLYFADAVEMGKGMGEGLVRVHYQALYPGESLHFSRNLLGTEGFGEIVRKSNSNPRELSEPPMLRFTLIKDLPPKKAQILLPGAEIFFPSEKHGFVPKRIARVFERDQKIFVELQGLSGENTESISLSDFLEMNISLLSHG